VSLSRLQQTVSAIVQALVGRRLDYACLYPATVIAQAGDGSLEVLADDPVVRGTGQRAIQVRHGLTGAQQTIPPGARCVLAFAAADPSRPFVMAWDRSSTATRGAARLNDTVDCGAIAFDPIAPMVHYQPPGGVLAPVAAPPLSTPLDGVIDSASTVTRLE
jgi:hypothetical protein